MKLGNTGLNVSYIVKVVCLAVASKKIFAYRSTHSIKLFQRNSNIILSFK